MHWFFSDTISYAKAIVKHAKNDPIFLSFEVGENIKVKSKEAGERRDLWGGEVSLTPISYSDPSNVLTHFNINYYLFFLDEVKKT